MKPRKEKNKQCHRRGRKKKEKKNAVTPAENEGEWAALFLSNITQRCNPNRVQVPLFLPTPEGDKLHGRYRTSVNTPTKPRRMAGYRTYRVQIIVRRLMRKINRKYLPNDKDDIPHIPNDKDNINSRTRQTSRADYRTPRAPKLSYAR